MPGPNAWGGGARQLLRRVRDLMASPAPVEQRLNELVRIIAASFVAEVCSVYVMRAGEVLELFATVGLRPEAIHKTRLRVGEGLVGHIAALASPVALADAQSHPNFAYRPETGEEIFSSLMGVPLLSRGRVVGVLAVQNRIARDYDEEDVESLQTIAMGVAELVSSGDLVGASELEPRDGLPMPMRLIGISLNSGLAMGRAVLHNTNFSLTRLYADDPEAELVKLRAAMSALHASIETMIDRLIADGREDLGGHAEPRDILETYRMFAHDRGWQRRMTEAIRTGLSAEAAVYQVLNDTRARMSTISDAYLRERLIDLEDLNQRLLMHLTGNESSRRDLPIDAVLVARALGPADLLDYDVRRLKAVVLEEGSPTDHVAIVARAFDVPVVGRVPGLLLKVEEGDPIVVDGKIGQIFVRPSDEVRETFAQSIHALAAQKALYLTTYDLPSKTLDDKDIALHLNAGLLLDLEHLKHSGVEGIGLYRTEIPFMIRQGYPDVATQEEIYRRILDEANDKPVTFRTLDVGGDKILPYLAKTEEENPAMGWRAIRIALDRPAMLRQQLRALVRASADRHLRVMFPMVAETAEFITARQLLMRELEHTEHEKQCTPSRIEVGVMLEVPALAFQLDSLLPLTDFVSIGSNDLLQFLFAADRSNPLLAGRYDGLAPASLKFLQHILHQCQAAKRPVAVCGEMAGKPLEAMALIGLGFHILSMAPPALGPVKMMIRSLNLAQFQPFLLDLLTLSNHSLRNRLTAFAQDHGVVLDGNSK
ncbi:MAG: phosphoenolpyruvate--protein phosphotransferase [Alphaproteobacteria bacterium]